MEYFKDLLRKEKSKYALASGILFLTGALLSIPMKLAESNTLSTFDWIFSTLFLFNGLYWVTIGFGFQIERIFGKAYVKIDSVKISIKTGVFEKLQEIDWKEINSIEYNSSNFIIKRKNGTDYYISLSNLEYATIQQIKDVVDRISKSKNIVSAIFL